MAHGSALFSLDISQINGVEKLPYKSVHSSGISEFLAELGAKISNKSRLVGSILVCASQNIGMLIVGRVINGLSVGVSTPLSLRCHLLMMKRFVLLKFQFISQSLHHPANEADLSEANNGL